VSAPLILVVEDNETNQMLTVAVLERAGYRVAVAGSADEARRHLGEASPDLILMDVQLPGEDGLALTRELRSHATTGSIPIVAMTAHAMDGDAELAIDAGCTGYITKPIDTRAFAEQVRKNLAVTR
jgi:CheY-like chemotaxis protein